jgi:hypothetical protein
MKYDISRMSASEIAEPSNVDAEIELLAQETHVPRAIVEKLYSTARARLESTARIKTYVPVIIHRQVKALLREQQRA